MNDIVKDFNKNSFLFLLIAGSVVLCVVRALLENSLVGSFLAAGACASFLIWYFFMVKQDTEKMHNPDNCYYLGLLFTLVSLIYSLITLFLLNSGADDVARRTHNLIGSFGIALFSTFLGILLRILLLQSSAVGTVVGSRKFKLSEWQDELRTQAHADLNEAAFRLRHELTQTIADMNIFRIAVIQAANETTQHVNKTRDAMTDQVEQVTEKQAEILSTLSAAVVAKLAETVDRITASVNTLKRPLDALAAAQTEQARKIHATTEKVTDGGEKLAASIQSVLEPLQDIIGNLQSTNQGIQTISLNYEALNSSLQQSVKFFGGIRTETEQSANALTAATEDFSRSLTKVTPQYTRQFAELVTKLREESEQWQLMTTKVRTSLVQAVEKLTDDAINSSP